MFKKVLAAATFSAMILSVPVWAQEDETAYRNEVTVLGMGSFVKQTTQQSVDQVATNSGGVLASYRFWFDRHSGIEANYAFTQNTEKYGLTGVDTNSHEVSGAYVFRIPMRRLTPFVLAGAGALVFDPQNFTGASSQTRAAFVYGGGADVSLTRHLYMRAEYRGLVYNSPTYDVSGFNGLDRVTHRAEPTLGFGWRF